MDDLFLFEHKQQLLQKNRERFNQRRNGRRSMLTSSPASSQNSDESDEMRKKSNSKVAAPSDSEDEDGRAKRSKLNHDRADEQLKCSPNVTNQKRPPQNAVDEEKLAKLRACFSSDSDSDDDDPVAAIKKRQIAARNRKKGWTLPEESVDDSKAARSPQKAVTATEQSPPSFKQPSEESSLPPNPTLETKMPSLNNTASKREYAYMDIDTNMIMEDAIPPSKTSPTESKKETPSATMKADVDNEDIDIEMMIDDSAAKTDSPSAKKTATMMKVDVDEENEPMSLTIVSWNINEAKCSRVAPDPELRVREAPRLISEEILRSQPDVIALQETPTSSFGAEKFAEDGYVSVAGTTQSHSGHVDLLVKRELALGATRISLQSDLPAVAAILTLPNRTRIAIASLHLAPSELSSERKLECNVIMEHLTSQAREVILAGDFNMRQSEDKTTERLCGGNWVDAWKEATNSNPKKKFTWNTAENKYFDNPPRTIRFDRCYGRGEKLRVTHFDLIGNQPVDGMQGDYLSDHYGLVAKYEVESSDATPQDKAAAALVGGTMSSLPTSKSANDTSSSLKDGTNEVTLRAARLQRFENASGPTEHDNATSKLADNALGIIATLSAAARARLQSFENASKPDAKERSARKGNQEIIELLDDSDDEDDIDVNVKTKSFEADRALAERLQRKEDIDANLGSLAADHAFAERSLEQEEGCSATGVDYSNVRPGVFGSLHDKHASLRADGEAKLSPSQNGGFSTYVRGGVFMDTHPQSWSSGGWVWVKNPQYAIDNPKARVDTEDDVARMSTEWKSLKKSNVKITHRHLIDLAKKHNVLHGKWLLWIKAEDVQTDWPKVRNAIVDGKLGSVAKISDTPDKRGHVVCIYCPNFLDKDELLRIRRAIRNDVGLYRNSVLRFKLDAVTVVNIYAHNAKLRTTSYDCGGENDEECSTLISHWEKCTMSEGCKRCYPCCLGRKPKKEYVYSITGLKYANASAVQGEKVTLLREPENQYDTNAVKVVNGAGQLIGHIAKDKAEILSPKMKAMQEDLQSQHMTFSVEGTIISVSDGYQQSVQIEFKEIPIETCDAEVVVLE